MMVGGKDGLIGVEIEDLKECAADVPQTEEQACLRGL